MLTELCAELKNYFLRDREGDIYTGTYKISGGNIGTLPFLLDGQYFRIVGSVFNDGVHKYPATDLTDENFTGAIWAMAVPPAVVELAAEIDAWTKKNAEVINSPYASESFGGYSYTLKSYGGSNYSTDGDYSWRSQFASRLNKWRRLAVL